MNANDKKKRKLTDRDRIGQVESMLPHATRALPAFTSIIKRLSQPALDRPLLKTVKTKNTQVSQTFFHGK